MTRLPAYPVYMAMEGVLSILFSMIFVASSLYQVTVAGLTPLQLVLVGTTLELSVFLFEIPTGVVADVYSRRLSIVIGIFLIGLGFLVEGSFPVFGMIVLAQVLWGVGYTFTSGATQAWISDEIGEDAAAQAFLRSSQLDKIGGLIGLGLGAIVGTWGVNRPIQLGGVLICLLAVSLSFIMPEHGFQPAPRGERGSWGQMFFTFRQGLTTVRGRPALMTILLIGLFFGLYSEGFDRLWTRHLIDYFGKTLVEFGEPVVWVAALDGVTLLLSIGAVEVVRRKLPTGDSVRSAKAMFAFSAAIVIGLVGFALSPWLALTLCCYCMISVARNLSAPVYDAWINQRLDSSVRATVLSMSGQVDAIGQITGGPVIGLIGSRISVSAALLSSAAILAPVLGLFRRSRRQGDETIPAQVE